MRKLSRRHKENIEKTSKTIYSNLEDAIEILKSTATTKFVETVELHANLNIAALQAWMFIENAEAFSGAAPQTSADLA
jgi:ribosomal protein L1